MIAEELRIGNIVSYIGSNIKITNIGLFNIQSEYGRNVIKTSLKTKNLNPIPITKDILLRLGFKETAYHQYTLGEQIVSFSETDGLSFWIMETELTFKRRYLHELQNLWFTFYGTEVNTAGLL